MGPEFPTRVPSVSEMTSTSESRTLDIETKPSHPPPQDSPSTSAKRTTPQRDIAAEQRLQRAATTRSRLTQLSSVPKQSKWARIKQNLSGGGKAARQQAVLQELEAERDRQRSMDPSPFSIRPIVLADLMDPKSIEGLEALGGTDKLLADLGTDGERGLDLTVTGGTGSTAPTDIEAVSGISSEKTTSKYTKTKASREDRQRVYGRNVLPTKKAKSLWLLMAQALQDKILIILLIAALISLALGFYNDYGTETEYTPCDNPPAGQLECPRPKVEWVEGLAILVAVAVVVTVGSGNDFAKEKQLEALNAQKEERDVRVIRQGRPALMSVHEVLVGDILQIEPGEVIPADGVLLRGSNLKCDESGATGESDLIRKVPYEDCLADLNLARQKANAGPVAHSKRDPFLISGSRVQEGVGDYVVTSVGTMSFNGKLMVTLRNTETEDTPLQSKLNHLAGIIAKLGSAAGLLLFVVLFIRFLADLKGFVGDANEKGERFIQVLILSVTVVVVAIPEGLPLAVTLALAFATRKMAKQNLLVRLLGSCETMGAATVICTDKTGTLTQNQMTVVAGSIGADCRFVRHLDAHSERSLVVRDDRDRNIDQSELANIVAGPLRQLWNDSIAVNSTAFEEDAADEAAHEKARPKTFLGKALAVFKSSKKTSTVNETKSNGFVGSKTETALLSFAKDLGWEHYYARRKACEVTISYPFSSERKAMAVVIKKDDGTGYRLLVKGASEVILDLCSAVVDVAPEGSADNDVAAHALNEEERIKTQQTITAFASQSLRTLGMAYRDFEEWPPAQATFHDDDNIAQSGGDDGDEPTEVEYHSIAHGMTLVSIVAIEDPLRDGVAQAVKDAHTAGLRVIMVTGDNALTGKSIATQCGIYDPTAPEEQIVMEGPTFRRMPDLELRRDVVPRLAVLARSSPQDKQKLVEMLKSMREIVAVTGDGTNDAAALKSANIGFSMGITGTEIAKEASDIILLDDRFSSIVTALVWGRSVRDSVRKFLQFQIAINIGAVLITFVTSVASSDEESALTAVQLLWLNLIMDTLAALALATAPPIAESVINRKPERPSGPLITTDMWKMIVGQAIYQVILILVLNFAGSAIFDLPTNIPEDSTLASHNTAVLKALTFNTFVWCQLFNQINCRRLDRGLNIFEGILTNHWFTLILVIETAAQILIIFVGGAAFSVTRLEGKYWAVSIVAGFLCLPLAVLIRMVPTAPIERKLIDLGLISDANSAESLYEAPDYKEAYEKLKSLQWSEPRLGELAGDLEAMKEREEMSRGRRLDLLFGGLRERKLTRELARIGHKDDAAAEGAAEETTAASAQRSGQTLSLSASGQGANGNGNNSSPTKFSRRKSSFAASSSHSMDKTSSSSTTAHSPRYGVLVPGLSIAGVAGAWRPTCVVFDDQNQNQNQSASAMATVTATATATQGQGQGQVGIADAAAATDADGSPSTATTIEHSATEQQPASASASASPTTTTTTTRN